jgi:hypothetical protein
MAISSPLTTYTWGIVGDRLAILRTNTTSGEWEAINESTDAAILVHFWGEPDSIESENDYPDVDNALHEAFPDFLKYKIFLDLANKAVTGENPTESDIILGREYRALSREHKKTYDEKIRHYGRNKIDKVGGSRVVPAASLR